MSLFRSTIELFKRNHAPLIRARGWRVPFPVSQKLVDFIHNFDELRKLKYDERTLRLWDLADAHAESTLFVLIGNTLIAGVYLNKDKRKEEIERLEEAKAAFWNSVDNEGFLKDREQFGWKGVFATSVTLALLLKHKVEENQKDF